MSFGNQTDSKVNHYSGPETHFLNPKVTVACVQGRYLLFYPGVGAWSQNDFLGFIIEIRGGFAAFFPTPDPWGPFPREMPSNKLPPVYPTEAVRGPSPRMVPVRLPMSPWAVVPRKWET